MQLKLDELIRATRARDSFIDIEDLSDEELSKLAQKFKRIHEQEDRDPVLHKFNQKLNHALNSRVETLPGGKAATDMANKLNPFSDHDSHKK